MSNRKSKKIKEISPPSDQNWFEGTTAKITQIGGAVVVLLSVGGGAYTVGGTFKENEKKIEIYDLKQSHKKEIDSLLSKIEKYKEEVKILKKSNSNEKK